MNLEDTAVIITPDAVRDGLEQQILHDLLAIGPMRVLWQRYWQIEDPGIVLTIYPRLLGRPFYSSVLRTMTLGKCLVLLLQGENTFSLLKNAKGKIDYNGYSVDVTGLRLKYRSWSPEEVRFLGCRNKAVLDKIFEFRLHTADTLFETATICSLCMSREELEVLRDVAPTLYAEINKIKSEGPAGGL